MKWLCSRILLLTLVVCMFSATLVRAKGIPTFFTIEGNGITTAIPFRTDFNHSGPTWGIFDVENRLEESEIERGEFYIIRGYSQFIDAERNDERRVIESIWTNMRYFRNQMEQG